MTVEDMLAAARRRLTRLQPHEARTAMADGALLIDIRSESQRRADGVVPGALAVSRNVLEWRCDPSCPARDRRIGGLDRQLIVMCNQGYGSSLAAAGLQDLGFQRATDLVGGFQAWRSAGLPVDEFLPEELARAVDCSCGLRVQAADDARLLHDWRAHLIAGHEAERYADEDLRERIAAEGYDVPVAEPLARTRLQRWQTASMLWSSGSRAKAP
jgi:rhodanese-related sulfurtransferase